MNNKGIIPINKPSGWTSFDVVNKVKHLLRQIYGKGMPKVGHLGTLDPMATGVLLVTVGSATKLFDIMQEKHKTYVAKFAFGEETDTLDSTGNLVNTTKIIPTKNQIFNILPNFIGNIEQMPPRYSAKSINGKRAYELARNNIDFELKPKNVKIFNIDFIGYDENILEIKIECGSGTYIRSIGRDIAYSLNSLANMISLVRTKIDNFDLVNCLEISSINTENLSNLIIPINNILNYSILDLSEIQTKKLLNGQTIELNELDGIYKVNDNFDTVALIKICNFKAKMLVFLG